MNMLCRYPQHWPLQILEIGQVTTAESGCLCVRLMFYSLTPSLSQCDVLEVNPSASVLLYCSSRGLCRQFLLPRNVLSQNVMGGSEVSLLNDSPGVPHFRALVTFRLDSVLYLEAWQLLKIFKALNTFFLAFLSSQTAKHSKKNLISYLYARES